MPTQYEMLTSDDVVTTRTVLHESIPLTGTIISGTYGTFPNEGNIKNYTHGQFESVYDYPYLSSSSNHILDLSIGYPATSALSGAASTQNAKKINMYNQMAQVLLGYESSSQGLIEKFEADLSLDNSGIMSEVFFLNFSRLITKDQIKKGTFNLTLGTGSWAAPFAKKMPLSDASASATQGTATSIGGEYGVLYDTTAHPYVPRGVVFYQAGVAVLSASAFDNVADFYKSPTWGNQSPRQAMTGSSISSSCDALRHRVQNISFNNTTEINSTIYFCRAPANKFNNSSNPTYVSGGTCVVKNIASDQPVSYITTVGLYNANNELLAVAKLSEPLKKDPTNELTLRVRLDY